MVANVEESKETRIIGDKFGTIVKSIYPTNSLFEYTHGYANREGRFRCKAANDEHRTATSFISTRLHIIAEVFGRVGGKDTGQDCNNDQQPRPALHVTSICQGYTLVSLLRVSRSEDVFCDIIRRRLLTGKQ